MIDRTRSNGRHLLQSRRWILLTVVTIAATAAVGCQGRDDLATPDQALTAPVRTREVTEPPAVPTATPKPDSTPPPTTTVPPTATPDPDFTSGLATPTQEVPTTSSTMPVGPEVGAIAPDLALTNLAGEEVSLRDQRGKAVLLNFWASW